MLSGAVIMHEAGWLLTLLAVLLISGILLTRTLLARRRHIWRRFAGRHGLQHSRADGQTHVSGRVNGRAFSLSTSAGAGETGEMGVQQITIRLELHSSVPPQLEIRKVEGVFGALARAVDEETQPTGDADFDHWFVVTGVNQEELARILTPAQKRVLEELAGESGQACVGIEEGALFWSDREIVSRLSELEGYLAELLQAAAVFDAAAGTGQENRAESAV